MAIQLRKKAPFTCRTVISGRLTCLAVLIETDGDLCAPCAAKLKAIREAKIAPVIPPEPVRSSWDDPAEVERRRTRWPFWPLNNDGTPCSPEVR